MSKGSFEACPNMVLYKRNTIIPRDPDPYVSQLKDLGHQVCVLLSKRR